MNTIRQFVSSASWYIEKFYSDTSHTGLNAIKFYLFAIEIPYCEPNSAKVSRKSIAPDKGGMCQRADVQLKYFIILRYEWVKLLVEIDIRLNIGASVGSPNLLWNGIPNNFGSVMPNSLSKLRTPKAISLSTTPKSAIPYLSLSKNRERTNSSSK